MHIFCVMSPKVNPQKIVIEDESSASNFEMIDIKEEYDETSNSDLKSTEEEDIAPDSHFRRKSKVDKKDSSSKIKRIQRSSKVSELESDLEEEDESELTTDDDDDTAKIGDIFKERISYRPTEEERLKLSSMFINLSHKVPPQHTIEKGAGTRTLKKYQRLKFNQYVPLKTGSFSANEDKILYKNWLAFCQLHDWNPKNAKPFLQMKHKNKEFFLSLRNRIKFVQFLGDRLFNRSLYSIYQRFKVKFDPHKVTRYKATEDRIIFNFINNHNKVNIKDRKFADLALILKRTRASVWRRYRLLKKHQENEKLKDVTSC